MVDFVSKSSKRYVTPCGALMFPFLFEPQQDKASVSHTERKRGKPLYKSELLLPKGDPDCVDFYNRLQSEADKAWFAFTGGDCGDVLPKDAVKFWFDGDSPTAVHARHSGNYVLRVANAHPPALMRVEGEQFIPLRRGELIGGDLVHVSYDLLAFDRGAGYRGVSAALQGVVFVGEGDRYLSTTPEYVEAVRDFDFLLSTNY